MTKVDNYRLNEYDVDTESQSDGTVRQKVIPCSFVPHSYDYCAITYVAAGNGAGEIETVTYKTGGASGTTVATLTFAYNGDDEISSITKT